MLEVLSNFLAIFINIVCDICLYIILFVVAVKSLLFKMKNHRQRVLGTRTGARTMAPGLGTTMVSILVAQ